MNRAEVLFAIAVLFVVEVNHLKWIIWNYWECKHCGVTHRTCRCKGTPKWMLYL